MPVHIPASDWMFIGLGGIEFMVLGFLASGFGRNATGPTSLQ
jgi:hypothetical protein